MANETESAEPLKKILTSDLNIVGEETTLIDFPDSLKIEVHSINSDTPKPNLQFEVVLKNTGSKPARFLADEDLSKSVRPVLNPFRIQSKRSVDKKSDQRLERPNVPPKRNLFEMPPKSELNWTIELSLPDVAYSEEPKTFVYWDSNFGRRSPTGWVKVQLPKSVRAETLKTNLQKIDWDSLPKTELDWQKAYERAKNIELSEDIILEVPAFAHRSPSEIFGSMKIFNVGKACNLVFSKWPEEGLFQSNVFELDLIETSDLAKAQFRFERDRKGKHFEVSFPAKSWLEIPFRYPLSHVKAKNLNSIELGIFWRLNLERGNRPHFFAGYLFAVKDLNGL